jgi:hypothetical protein
MYVASVLSLILWAFADIHNLALRLFSGIGIAFE